MCVVIEVRPVNLGDQPSVALDRNASVRKELPDPGGNRCGRVWGAATLPDYHEFPLIEEVVTPREDVKDQVRPIRQGSSGAGHWLDIGGTADSRQIHGFLHLDRLPLYPGRPRRTIEGIDGEPGVGQPGIV